MSGLCLCAAWLLSVGLAYLVHMGSAQNIPAPASQYYLENIVYLVFAFVIMAIILPIRLKYGYGETSKSFMVFALLALVAMICFGPELAQGIQQFPENYPAGSGFLQSLPFRVAFGIAVSLVSVMISYRVSIRVMDEKEY